MKYSDLIDKLKSGCEIHYYNEGGRNSYTLETKEGDSLDIHYKVADKLLKNHKCKERCMFIQGNEEGGFLDVKLKETV